MSRELRAKKIASLSKTSQFVEADNADDDNKITHWLLRWPSPLDNQHATVDATTGEVTDFRRQSGTVIEDVDPAPWVSTIDRRINYLFDVHKKGGAA